jgi:hypothetical protein
MTKLRSIGTPDLFASGMARRDDPDTSHDAADMDVSGLYAVVLATLRTRWPFGLTTWEISALSKVGFESISPRMVQLEELKLVARTEERRVPRMPPGKKKKQIVWVMTRKALPKLP